MRKYAIAGTAAVAAFAVSAFAATLNADAGSLQVGTDSLEKLAQTAEVKYRTEVNGAGERRLQFVVVEFDETIDDAFVNINGLKQGTGGPTNPNKVAWGGGKAIQDSKTVEFKLNPTASAEELIGTTVELKNAPSGNEIGGWGIGLNN